MKRIFLALLVMFGMTALKASVNDLSTYKSLFTLNFIRHVDWPEAAKQGDFVIGVLKNSDLAKSLQVKSAGKKFGYQNIVIKEFKTVDEVTDCQILYVGEFFNYSKYAETIAQKLHKSNSLIITEHDGSIDNGSMINFTIVDQKLKFEVSASNADNYGLKFSGSLVSMKNAIQK